VKPLPLSDAAVAERPPDATPDLPGRTPGDAAAIAAIILDPDATLAEIGDAREGTWTRNRSPGAGWMS
jgi:hypothetical protein